MNVVLTAEEMLKVYDLLIKSQSEDSLVGKFRSPILEILESEHEKKQKEMYESWISQEEQKIDGLNKKNENIKSILAGANFIKKRK